MNRVKVGYQVDFRNPPGSNISFVDLYGDLLSQVEYCDRSGFDSIWLTEHHFTDDGYLPALIPVAAAIAARTLRVTIGTYVLLAPFYHPVKLAEDAAVVDVISGGRLRLGLGLGYRAEEFEGFGIAREERFGRTIETIEILKRAWSGERFSYHGKYFTLRDVRVLPTPASKPYPELLWGAGAPAGIRRAAKLDMSFACVGGREEMGIFIEALKKEGKDPAKYSLVNSRVVYVADSEEQAWNDTRGPLMYQAELYGKWLSAAAKTNDPTKILIRPDPERLRRTSVLGTADEVTARLREILASAPITELIVVTQLPGLDTAKARRALERFTADVMPKLR
jgi:alkanesulfonate monooxygenase SsuD/methylene tetrahydromethanopterin reductase-like flavin-dependent oxidoreductase (luciferase family)